jgi:hypothetical protein
LAHLGGIFAIVFMWICYALICIGFGAWHLRIFRKGDKGKWSVTDFAAAFWLGLATWLGILQLWNFFAPVNFICHLVLTGAGSVSGLLLLKSLGRALTRLPRKTLFTAAGTLLIVLVFLANRATGPCAEYDSGLYHLQAIKWAENYPVVPGLANLHMRFGFSSTMTLFAACLDQGLWKDNASHLVNGLFLAGLAAMIVRSATKLFRDPRSGVEHWLLIAAAPLLTDWAMDIQAGSFSTDIGVAVLLVIAAHYFLAAFAEPSRWRIFAAIIVAAAAVTAKASALSLSAPLILILLVVLVRREKFRPALLATLIAAAFIVPWLIRQVMLSGYPLYPAEIFAMPVDWRMPVEKVEWYRHVILNWARWQRYDDTRQTLDWIAPWIQGRLENPVNLWKTYFPAAIAGVALLAALIKRFTARSKLPPAGAPLLLLACVTLSAIAWFVSAPDPRYASQIFTLLMAIGLVLLLPRIRIVAAFVLALAIGPLITAGGDTGWHIGYRTFANVWILPPREGIFYPTPESKLDHVFTPTGLTIYVPKTEAGEFEDRVWNAPLPATPRSEIDPSEVKIPPLRLRQPGNLGGGFTRAPLP